LVAGGNRSAAVPLALLTTIGRQNRYGPEAGRSPGGRILPDFELVAAEVSTIVVEADLPPIYGIMGGVEKTTVYLTTEQKRALERAARAAGRSEARLIREGIEAVTAATGIAETRTPLPEGRAPSVGDGGDTIVRRPRWMPRSELVRFLGQGADTGLRAELRRLSPDTTDDVMTR